jgi:hypothetical protein
VFAVGKNIDLDQNEPGFFRAMLVLTTPMEAVMFRHAFRVNHAGTVYQKDLGDYTMKPVTRMNWFDPEQTWKKANAEP